MAKKKKNKRTNKHLQITAQKTKDRATLKIGGELRYSGTVSSSCSTSDTRRVSLVTKPVISHDQILRIVQ